MKKPSSDAGVIATLLNRFETQRLPRALALKKKVNGGAALDEQELAFVEEALRDVRELSGLLERNPEYTEIVQGTLALYSGIIDKSAENTS